MTDITDDDSPINTETFLTGLDAIYSRHTGASEAEPYMLDALETAAEAGDDAAQLTIVNELMGFYRSQGRHEDNTRLAQASLELALRMGLEGSEEWMTVLINAATAMRAAGYYDQALALYQQALRASQDLPNASPRDKAALHNNLSMLYSETGDLKTALSELKTALDLMTQASTDPENDIDLATTHTNIALLLLQTPAEEDPAALPQALEEAKKALDIYHHDPSLDLTNSAHYASALAGYAQALLLNGRPTEAVSYYDQALASISETYGTDTDYYRTTAANAQVARQAAAGGKASGTKDKASGRTMNGTRNESADESAAASPAKTRMDPPSASPATTSDTPQTRIKGLALARKYWEAYGKPLIAEKYPAYTGRIAAGLVGHGSECYGFDDRFSQDHDFGPRFCLWLTEEDYQSIGDALQADYDSLPSEFLGYHMKAKTVRSQGERKRAGVFSIDSFFESLTGLAAPPSEDELILWLNLREDTLAAATNGRVFADPLGAFSSRRQAFKDMPDDIRFCLISRRLGMISQAGQYNFPRMLARKDRSAATLCLAEFADAVSSLVFLINNPLIVGYTPYYKWRFAALRQLSARPATRLSQVCPLVEEILANGPQAETTELIDQVCHLIVAELKNQSLTTSPEEFLEWQRPFIERHISPRHSFLRGI